MLWCGSTQGFSSSVNQGLKSMKKATVFNPNPSPGGKVAPKGSDEECGRRPESSYNITDLLHGWISLPGVGLCVSGHPTLPPAFLISHQSVPKSRLVTASPRGKRLGCSRTRRFFDSLRGPHHSVRSFSISVGAIQESPADAFGIGKRPDNDRIPIEGPAFKFLCHCEERSDVAIRIPCDAEHRPTPSGSERERIATSPVGSSQ